MTPTLITFDCASTLVEVDWEIGSFAYKCATEMGLHVPESAAELYTRMYHQNIAAFLEINRLRDPEKGRAWWRRLGEEWLATLGLPRDCIGELQDTADRLAFGKDSKVFQLYDDVIPCLDLIKERGIGMAIISNWDYSLHRVVEMLGIEDYFEVVLASLEEGVEKPDPRLFEICLQQMGVAPEQTLHVGDNQIDDIQGAQAAGVRGLLIDRTGQTPGALGTLTDIPEAFAWTA